MKENLSNLFSSFTLKDTTIKNRLVRSPMESSLGNPDGKVTNDHIRFYSTAAKGGVGLMIIEGIAVHPISKMTDTQMTAFDDSNIPGFTRLSNAIHENGEGVVLWAQLYCGGAASFGYSYGQNDYGLDLNDFSEDVIEEIIDSYANAALVLKKSGFDGVEIHGGHGYLVSQFISPAVNKRQDKWGGTPDNRIRFPLEILRKIREKCGLNYPIGIKMNSADFLREGNWLTDTAYVAKRFAEEGYDLIEASGGMGFMTELREAMRAKEGNHQYYFQECIPAFMKALEGTNTALCVTGGMGDPVEMDQLIAQGVDFIGLARPWLCEPDFANRVKAGDHRPTKCVSREHICNLCLTRLALGPVTCYKFFPGYCKMECPIDQDAPAYIAQIAEGNFEEAYRTILKDNPFVETLCRVCSRKCETVCKGKKGEGLAIRDLKRFAVEYGKKNNVSELFSPIISNYAEKIVIVGSGPAGLACAFQLATMGYHPIVLEKSNQAGGSLKAIPKFRLPEGALNTDIERIEEKGVVIKYNQELGEDISFLEIQNQYDAVFIASGSTTPTESRIEGSDKRKVYQAMDFLKSVNEGKTPKIGSKIVVVGGGSVAMDAAMTAMRLGAESVMIVCLEERDEMPADQWEVMDALEEGILLENGWGIEAIKGTDNVEGLALIKCTSVFDEEGMFSPSYESCTIKDVDADTIILAIGQTVDFAWVDTETKDLLFEDGKLVYDPITMQTKVEKVFIGGDLVTGPKTIVEAVKAGKDAALSIDRYLRGEEIKRTPKWESYEPFFLGATACGHECSVENVEREIPEKLSMDLRKGSFEEIQKVFTEEQAIKEARRCLKYDVDLERESKERYANMGKAQIDFRHLDGRPI